MRLTDFKIFICCLGLSVIFFGRAGAQNNSLFFDGIVDHVILPYLPTLDFGPTDKFTVEFWFKTNYANSSFISTFGTYYSNYGLDIALQSGYLDIKIINSYPTNAFRLLTPGTWNNGQWHHMSFSYDGSLSTVKHRLLIDGILQTTMPLQNSLTNSFSTGNSICIGGRGGVGDLFGQMDEIRIWHKDLCPGDVIARKDCELSGNEPGLLVYYNCNEGISTGTNTALNFLPDHSPSNITGTLVGFALTGGASNWVAGAPVNGACNVVSGDVSIKLSDNIKNGLLCEGGTATLVAIGSPGGIYAWKGANANATLVVTPSVATTYTAITISSTICPGTNTVLISPTPNPTIVPVFPPTICPGDSVTLTATGAAAYTWQPGSLTGSAVVVSPAFSTSYSITGTSTAGCVDDAQVPVNIDIGQNLFSLVSPPSCAGQTVLVGVSGAQTCTWQPGGTVTLNLVISPTTTSSYTAFASTYAGCIFKLPLTVTVLPVPEIVVAGPGPSCPGEPVSLGSDGADSYTWQPGGLNGFYITVQPTVTTTYTVFGSSGSGCTGSAQLTHEVLLCSSINSNDRSHEGLLVYPNPFEDSFVFRKGERNAVYQICDVTGRPVRQFTCMGNPTVVDTKDLLPGCYFLVPETGGGPVPERLIKK